MNDQLLLKYIEQEAKRRRWSSFQIAEEYIRFNSFGAVYGNVSYPTNGLSKDILIKHANAFSVVKSCNIKTPLSTDALFVTIQGKNIRRQAYDCWVMPTDSQPDFEPPLEVFEDFTAIRWLNGNPGPVYYGQISILIVTAGAPV